MHSFFVVEHEVQIRTQTARRYAENRRLIRTAGTVQPRRFPRPGCWLLCQLGRMLVALGQRLLEYGHPSTVTPKRQINHMPGSGHREIVI